MNMRAAVDQRTEPGSLPTPEPRMEPEATCVVDRPKPRWDDARIAMVDDVSAAKPCGASMSTMPLPIVRMMRQPPEYVPRPIAMPARAMTHQCGRVPSSCRPQPPGRG